MDTVYIQGQDTIPYKNAKLAFVVFLAKKDGKFKTVSMNERVDFAEFPLNLVIEIQPTGTIKEFEGFEDREAKEIYLDNPGILLSYCEKSAVVIYWDKQKEKFDELWVSF